MTSLNKFIVILGGIALTTTLILPDRQTVKVIDAVRRLISDSFATTMGTRSGNAR